ncbi:sugar phosphate isomerase/epimerase family protein [Paenibacillus sp. HJGM_3]|uniref:sugar phosphate isomerase/epimerase family protein n=1 Tax=Paenibacillus sp. HJGM_3 TaxID=3379816 RepID=UPI00385A361B
MENIVISPICNPDMELEEALLRYTTLGYHQFEVFTGRVKSAFDINLDPSIYLEAGKKYGMSYYSFHLPQITDDGDSLEYSIQAAHFAAKLGVKVVLFKAKSRDLYIQTAKTFLDQTEHLGITPVVQNHIGTPITTIEDYREVLEGIRDTRMKTLLEVGHFHSVGVSWREGYELLGDSIALVHIQDRIGSQGVPLGTGEIDLQGLFQHMHRVGYSGHYVLELIVKDQENTLHYLADAYQYLTHSSYVSQRGIH